jgi:hypothetical protein
MGAWIAISAIATIVIAIFAWRNWILADETKRSSDAYHKDLKQYHEDLKTYNEDLKSLFRAIVVATIIPSTGSYEKNLQHFVKLYPEAIKYLNEEELKRCQIKLFNE